MLATDEEVSQVSQWPLVEKMIPAKPDGMTKSGWLRKHLFPQLRNITKRLRLGKPQDPDLSDGRSDAL